MCTYTLDWTSHKLINQQNQNRIYANHNNKKKHTDLETPQNFFFSFFKSSGASHSLTYKRRSVHYSSLFAKQGKSQSFKEIGKKKMKVWNHPHSQHHEAYSSFHSGHRNVEVRRILWEILHNLYPTVSLTSGE